MADDPTPDPVPDPSSTPDPAPEPTPDRVSEPDDWKAHSRRHEREAKKARGEADELRAKLDEHEEASKSEQEKALGQARKEAADAARTETSDAYRQKILNAEIRAHAAGKFANPNLAVRLLDLDDDVFDGEGDVNGDTIANAIDEFLNLEENRGLKAGAPNGGRPEGSADAGKGSGEPNLGDMDVAAHLAAIKRHK